MTTAVMQDYFFGGVENVQPAIPMERSGEGVKAWFGLSPFHVPKGMQFCASSNREALIKFSYENDEPPEPGYRKLGKDLAVLLAEKSKKVLAIQIIGDVRQHLEQRTLFSTRYAKQLVGDVPSSASYSLIHSAQLVDALLKGLPDQFVREVIERLRLAGPVAP
jgi:hypothetical protein